MVIAYPANRNKKGKRVRSVLYFHVMANLSLREIDGKKLIPTESMGMESNTLIGETAQDSNKTKKLKRERMMTMFALKLRDTWVHAITTTLFPDDVGSGTCRYASVSSGKGKLLLVIINPYAGTKKGQEIANQGLLPMLQQAGVEYEVLLTSYAGHAQEFVGQGAIDRWKGIVCISGDGLLFEVLSGVFDREDWKEAIERLSFGVIPAGSGNGLSRSLVYLQGEQFHRGTHYLSAAINCARGSTRAMDLLYVETPVAYKLSFHSVSWGLVADINIESDVIRWMGDIRFTIYALISIIKCRRYRARLSYIPYYSEGVGDSKQILGPLYQKDLEERSNPDERSSKEYKPAIPMNSKIQKYKRSSPLENNDTEVESLALVEEKHIDSNQKRHTTKSNVRLDTWYKNNDNASGKYSDMEDGVSLPQIQQPRSYRNPRPVTYRTMYEQGQLYDRSWQELQVNVTGHASNKAHPTEYLQPTSTHQQMRYAQHVHGTRTHSDNSLSCPQHRQRIPPSIHPQHILIDHVPSKNDNSQHRLKQQASPSSSSYCVAAEIMKR